MQKTVKKDVICHAREPKRSRGRSEGAKSDGTRGRVDVSLGRGAGGQEVSLISVFVIWKIINRQDIFQVGVNLGKGAGGQEQMGGEQERRRRQMRRAQSEVAVNKKVICSAADS